MYLGRDFPPMDQPEQIGIVLDFVNDILDTEVISSIIVVQLTVKNGTDSNPSSHLFGVPILIPPTQCYQIVGGLVPGNVYTIQAYGRTNLGTIYSIWTHIPCEAIV